MVMVSSGLAIFLTVADLANERLATLATQSLAQAGEAYAINPANEGNRYPQVLADLSKPRFGGPSYLKNGVKDITDPWGRLYDCAYEANEKGDPQFYVWTERVVNGKVRVYGAKPPAPKKP
jgi:hypothetical protein